MKNHPWKQNNIFNHIPTVDLIGNKLERRQHAGRERRGKGHCKASTEIKIKEREL